MADSSRGGLVHRLSRPPVIAIFVVVLAAAAAGGCLWWVHDKNRSQTTSFGQSFVGGWGITKPEMIKRAANAGVKFVFLYGPPPEPTSPLGEALLHANMKVISAEVADLVSAYQCTRTLTVAPKPTDSKAESYCSTDPGYTESRVYDEVKTLVARDKNNPLVAGYWVLDDTADWDVGGVKPVLDKLAGIIPADRPKICGFSAGLGPHGRYEWNPGRAANFTSSGCDFVATYIYADSRRETDPPLKGIDWQMTGLLPMIKDNLRANGWEEDRRPLLGIAQAFGGRRAKNGAMTDPPSPAEMVLQARGYCDAGVRGMSWFAWSIATNYPTAQTPANSAELADGVREAAAACPAS